MKLIQQEKINKIIKKNFDYTFDIKEEGLYLIEIIASCKSWKQNLIKFISFFQDDDLTVKINDKEFPKLNGKRGLFDGEVAWNGNNLKSVSKTNVFVVHLDKDKNTIHFLVNKKPLLKSIKISMVENLEKIIYIPTTNNPAEDGNRRQWVNFILVDLPVKELSIQATAKTYKGQDDDDIKLIIDGEIQKNNEDKSHKNWFWCGKTSKGKEKEFKSLLQRKRGYKKLRLKQGLNYIELWADKKPFLHKVEMDVERIREKIEEEQSKIQYNDPIKIVEGFNPKYVLKDSAFNDKDAMNEKDIEDFLNKYHTIKDKPHISKIKFKGKKTSYWINKAAIEHFVNPKLLLTKLQAEQRLIKGDKAINPSKYQLNGSMGVGMFDDGTVIEELQGFINQINYAAKYFRKFYNEAESVHFTHENVDGKKLKTVNAATYSLYKYTPHIAGPELVYKVYKGFFNTDDLGGTLQKKESGFTRIKALFILISITTILLLASYLFINKNKPIYSWQNKILLGDNLELITDLKIFREKEATAEDGLYCGIRFYKIYESSMKLSLIENNKIIDSIDLTNPELVMPNLSTEHLTFYKPWDIDNDGIKQEFIVQEYGTCSSNLFSFVKVNKELKKLEKISVSHKNGKEAYTISVNIGKNSFKEEDGIIKTRYYDMTNLNISFSGFIKNYYKYSKDNNRLAWFKEEVDSTTSH